MFDEDGYFKVVEKLRLARREAGLTEEQVARAFGRPLKFIRSVEDGSRRIDPIELCRFAVLYQKPVVWFLPESGC